MADIPFPDYEPDKNRFNAGALPDINNVVPASDGYGPLPAIVPTPAIYRYLTFDNGDRITFDNGNRIIIALDWSDVIGFLALPDKPTGFFAARKSDGSEVMFAGTETALFKFRTDQCVWEDVSGMAYTSAARWYFYQWGDKVYCGNGSNPEQMFDLASDIKFSDNASAPICKYAMRVGNFIFRFNIVSWPAESITDAPNAFMCSGIEDPEDNIVGNYNWCDYQFIPDGGEIMGAVPVTGGAHIWLKGGVVPLAIPMASGVTFTLGEVDTTRGTSAPYSIGNIGLDRYIIYADDGWWYFNGGFSPIGQDRVNKTFLKTIDQDKFGEILSMADPENAVIWISYTNTAGQRRMLGFQYNLNKFTASDIAAAASYVCRTFLYSESDPPIVKANQPRFTILDQDNQLGYLVGAPMAARVTTNEVQLAEQGSYEATVKVNGDPVDFTATTITRDVKGGEARTRDPASPSEQSGAVAVHAEGFTHQWRIDIPAGEAWSTITGLSTDAKMAGKK